MKIKSYRISIRFFYISFIECFLFSIILFEVIGFMFNKTVEEVVNELDTNLDGGLNNQQVENKQKEYG